ncbi:uncharacterized protein VP01_2868g3 [Puccinia sorghi]|uniref:Uncharacterized protein n=1 Tax=Puccinia sorghi TaxID=27349 RepID=A0A0L6V2M4_9BASI|nr:uncharacterized protein VP01_2868g3 [Puccinia sorghi]
MEHIFKKNIPQREGLEPTQIIQLAQAITSDLLVCVQNTYPAKQFQLPCALTSK